MTFWTFRSRSCLGAKLLHGCRAPMHIFGWPRRPDGTIEHGAQDGEAGIAFQPALIVGTETGKSGREPPSTPGQESSQRPAPAADPCRPRPAQSPHGPRGSGRLPRQSPGSQPSSTSFSTLMNKGLPAKADSAEYGRIAEAGGAERQHLPILLFGGSKEICKRVRCRSQIADAAAGRQRRQM